MSGFRRGVRLGIDVGKARVGVARCDPDGMLATPVETVPRDDGSIGWLITHHSLDGRELNEPDRATDL